MSHIIPGDFDEKMQVEQHGHHILGILVVHRGIKNVGRELSCCRPNMLP